MSSAKQRRRIISILLFILAIIVFAMGLEMVGIAVAVIGLFFYPSNQAKTETDPMQQFYEDRMEEERERDDDRGDNDSSDGDSSGGSDD